MADNVLSTMLSRFPNTFNVTDTDTVLYAILSIYADKYKLNQSRLNRLYGMIGIDTTRNIDLEYRWGNLLGIHKHYDETYDNYRGRLKIAFSALIGGTEHAIKYSIAAVIGISNDYDTINKYINVYDAWEYNLTDESKQYITQQYGDFICTIDIDANEFIQGMDSDIMDAINKTKASGTRPYLIFIQNLDDEGTIHQYDETMFDTIMDSKEDTAPLSPHGIPHVFIDNKNVVIRYSNGNLTIVSGVTADITVPSITVTTGNDIELYDDKISFVSGNQKYSSTFGEGVFGMSIFNTGGEFEYDIKLGSSDTLNDVFDTAIVWHGEYYGINSVNVVNDSVSYEYADNMLSLSGNITVDSYDDNIVTSTTTRE